ncbi:MAG: DUF955 domain-containing protein [Verrucomicrobiaceae bacterium]|nr:DUF955 domain-containing protein [Verrucomicrobiaceae bacterium]
MKSPQIRERDKSSIETRVAKLLKELGNPEPPLRLEDVRFLLEINLGYFQHDDAGVMKRLAHRLKVAGHQLANRPWLLIDAVKRLDLRALWVPDQKFIMIDKEQPEAKWRWLEAHEMGHKLCDWHGPFLFGDNKFTLSPECHLKLEAEANYTAGQLLFLGDKFRGEASDVKLGFSSVKQLQGRYKNTLTTTLWRFIEQRGHQQPIVGLISCHPHPSKHPASGGDLCRHFIQSPAFATRFSKINGLSLFHQVAGYCKPQKGGLVGEDELDLQDDDGDTHRFQFETFFNQYDALTLGWHISKKPRLVSLA